MWCNKAPLIVNSTNELVEILSAESKKRVRAQRIGAYTAGGLIAFYAILYLGLWLVHKDASSVATSFSGFGGFMGVGAALTSRHKKALKLAAEDGDPRLTGYLLEATSFSDPKVAEMARDALVARLPDVTEPEQLDEDSRRFLYKSLSQRASQPYIVAALEAIRRVGDREALAPLEAFMVKPGKRPSASGDKVRTLGVLAEVRMRVARNIIAQRTSQSGQATELSGTASAEDHSESTVSTRS